MQVAETFTTEFGALFDEKEMGLEEGLSDDDRAVLVDVYAMLPLPLVPGQIDQ